MYLPLVVLAGATSWITIIEEITGWSVICYVTSLDMNSHWWGSLKLCGLSETEELWWSYVDAVINCKLLVKMVYLWLQLRWWPGNSGNCVDFHAIEKAKSWYWRSDSGGISKQSLHWGTCSVVLTRNHFSCPDSTRSQLAGVAQILIRQARHEEKIN